MVSKSTDIENFLKFSMSEPDPYDAPVPDMLVDLDKQYQEQKSQENEVRSQLEQHQQKAQSQEGQQGIIPPIGIAKPELVDSVLQNMGEDKKILEAIQEAERYEKESSWESVAREGGSYAARGLEGFFGGIGQFLNLLTPELYESEEGIPYGPGEQYQGFPGPERLHEITKEKTGKYFEPKSERQKAIQEFTSDVGSMFSTPGLGAIAKVALPGVGQITKQVLRLSGATETQQDLGKLGMMGIASIANLGNARAVAGQAMNTARNMIPQGLRIAAQPTQRILNNIRNQAWFRTGSTPNKAHAMGFVDRIERLIQNNSLDLHDAMQLRVDINEARRSLGAFNIPPVTDRAAARRYLDQVDRAILESMEHYGAHVNPQWLHNYEMANQAFALTQRSTAMAQFIERHAKPLQSDMAKVLFHAGGAGLTAGIGLGGALGALSGVAGVGALAGQTYKIMNRMIRSPLLRQHYTQVLTAAATGNAAVMNKELEKFDKIARKHEPPKEKNQ